MKAILFDVDGTLSAHGTAIPATVAQQLRDIEEKGIHIIIASGKPAHYLAGLARGMGLEKAKLIGENGCVIFDSATLKEIHLSKRLKEINDLEDAVLAHFKDNIWIQPNRVALTVFPLDQNKVPAIASYMKEPITSVAKDIIMYEHVDAVDIIPVGVNKAVAVKKLLKDLQVDRDQVLAVGDSTNDLPMFAEAGQVMIIGGNITFQNAIEFKTIDDAFTSREFMDFINTEIMFNGDECKNES